MANLELVSIHNPVITLVLCLGVIGYLPHLNVSFNFYDEVRCFGLWLGMKDTPRISGLLLEYKFVHFNTYS